MWTSTLPDLWISTISHEYPYFSIPSRPLRLGGYREDKENQGPPAGEDADEDEGPVLYRPDGGDDESLEEEGNDFLYMSGTRPCGAV